MTNHQNVTVTTQYDDLPLIRCRKTPTDAELEAERDAKHRAQCAHDEGGDEDGWPLLQVLA